MPVSRERIEAELAGLLRPETFRDHCPNGLQVEGAERIGRIVSGVTASAALIDAAAGAGADMLLVHHGYFWRGEDPAVVGMKKRRIGALLARGINLFAYHLPLDVHPELGNNAQLAKLLGFRPGGGLGRPGEPELVRVGRLDEPLDFDAFARRVGERLGRPPLAVRGRADPIGSVAWCTGAAQGYIDLAVAAGVDAYLTGEVSEPTVHVARESGLHFFAAGHHATERYGVKALGEHLAGKFGLEHRFIDIDNPA